MDPESNPKTAYLLESVAREESPAFERVAEYIRLAIIKGDFSPSQRIPQEDIAALLNVSRMPVREALRSLEREGFVRIIPKRGAVVRELSIQDVREVYEIRIQLEGLAARLAAPIATDEQIRRLNGLIAHMKEALDRGDIHNLLDLNKQFHETCNESVDNMRLLHMVHDLRNYSPRYRIFHGHIPDRLRVSFEEHKQILHAFEMRDGESAERYTKYNMQRTADVLIEYLEKHWGRMAGMLTTVRA